MATTKRTKAATAKKRAKAPTASFPYPHIGHGTSRVTDNFEIWIVFSREPDADARAAIEAAIPEALAEQARSDSGTLAWSGTLLHVDSGPDFKYFVAHYDPSYLAWIDPSKPLDDDDLARVTAEVMDPSTKGPRNPKRTAWDAFDADIELWLARAAARAPITLVVKDVNLRDTDAWHVWSATAVQERLPALVDTLKPLARSTSDEVLFVRPLLDAVVRATSSLAPDVFAAAIALLDLEARPLDADVFAKLVTGVPAKKRAAFVADLFRAKHRAAVGLFVAAPTKALLLDDTVFAAALDVVADVPLPAYAWLTRGTIAKRVTDREWTRRILALIEKHGELAADAAREIAEKSVANFARQALAVFERLRAQVA
jgi:hypothetical protein